MFTHRQVIAVVRTVFVPPDLKVLSGLKVIREFKETQVFRVLRELPDP
jgi:hypothetical protein